MTKSVTKASEVESDFSIFLFFFLFETVGPHFDTYHKVKLMTLLNESENRVQQGELSYKGASFTNRHEFSGAVERRAVNCRIQHTS